MSITTILFDLDGTLLPMDQDTFAKAYVSGLTVAAEPAGYSPMILSTVIMAGTASMVKNNGAKTNEDVFWDTLERTYGESVRNDIHMFDEIYATDFQKIKDVCGFNLKAAEQLGMKVFLLTNCLINKQNTDISVYPNGDFDKLIEYIENL